MKSAFSKNKTFIHSLVNIVLYKVNTWRPVHVYHVDQDLPAHGDAVVWHQGHSHLLLYDTSLSIRKVKINK